MVERDGAGELLSDHPKQEGEVLGRENRRCALARVPKLAWDERGATDRCRELGDARITSRDFHTHESERVRLARIRLERVLGAQVPRAIKQLVDDGFASSPAEVSAKGEAHEPIEV